MDAAIQEILKKTAVYVEVAQTEIDRNNDKRMAFLKRADEVANKLASKGILPVDSVDTFKSKIAANEVEVWSLVEKLADAVPVDDMVSRSTEKLAAQGTKMGPWERMFYFGSSRADASGNGILE